MNILFKHICLSKVLKTLQAKVHITEILTKKCIFWDQLPWKLIGMAHPEEAEARRAAERSVTLFNMVPAEEEFHHPLAWRLLSAGSLLREQINAFVAGSSLADLPELLMEVASLAFTPVVERVIERDHAEVHRILATRKVRGAYVSFGLRSSELEQMLRSDIQHDEVCNCVDLVRNPRQLMLRLGIAGHPLALQGIRQKLHVNYFFVIANQVLYSLDLETQYAAVAALKSANEKAKATRAKKAAVLAGASLKRKKRSCTSDGVLAYAAEEHFKKVARRGEYFTMSSDLTVSSLEQKQLSALAVSRTATVRTEAVELENDCEAIPARRPLYFKLINATPGDAKIVQTMWASGSKIGESNIFKFELQIII